MTARRLLCLIALGLAGVATAVPSSSAAPRQAAKDGGILRMGTTDPFDSMNPFVAFSALSYVAFTNIYPTLVQYDRNFKIAGRLGDVLEDLEGRPDLDVHAQAGEVVRRQAADGR